MPLVLIWTGGLSLGVQEPRPYEGEGRPHLPTQHWVCVLAIVDWKLHFKLKLL